MIMIIQIRYQTAMKIYIKSYKEKIKLQSKLDCNFILNMTKPIQDYRRQNT